MRMELIVLGALLGVTIALPGASPNTTNSYPEEPSHCGDDCGGTCGDSIVQAPYEQCDLGPELNGVAGSGCTSDCQLCSICGNGIVEPGEDCDLGFDLNGYPNSGCSADCKRVPVCGNGIIEEVSTQTPYFVYP